MLFAGLHCRRKCSSSRLGIGPCNQELSISGVSLVHKKAQALTTVLGTQKTSQELDVHRSAALRTLGVSFGAVLGTDGARAARASLCETARKR